MIVEDEAGLVTLLKYNLEKQGYETIVAMDGKEVMPMAMAEKPDLILLDWMLPNVQGIDLCRDIRKSYELRNTPIIMLTARGDEADKVRGLSYGADDYMTKPYSIPELMARIVALLRRVAPQEKHDNLMFEDLTMDFAKRRVMRGELYPEKAPNTVNNFISLANKGFYDGLTFHRVIPGFMIQGGGLTARMQQKDTSAPIKNEADNGLKNDRGTIAMARTNDPDSATAQFFINVVDNDFLNHTSPTPQGWGYAVFGKVVAGTDVVDAIAKVKTGTRGFHGDVPREDVVIEKAEIVD